MTDPTPDQLTERSITHRVSRVNDATDSKPGDGSVLDTYLDDRCTTCGAPARYARDRGWEHSPNDPAPSYDHEPDMPAPGDEDTRWRVMLEYDPLVVEG